MQKPFLVMDIVLVAVILCCWQLGVAQQFTAVQQPNSWHEAVRACREQGRRLQVTSDPWPPTSDPMWLGAQLVQSSWLWSDGKPLYPHEGCYSSPGLLDVNYNQSMTVSLCMQLCKKKETLSPVQYIALQDDKCWCLNNYQGMTADKEGCSTRCPGDPQVFCGGPKAVSIYRDDNGHFPWQPAGSLQGDCAYLYWSFQAAASLDSVVMKTDVCDLQATERKRFFCLQCDPSSQCSMMVNSAYKTWEMANATCRLAPVTKDDKPKFNFSVGTNEYYWIGLSRQTKWIWLNGEEVTGAKASNWQAPRSGGTCLAMAVKPGSPPTLTYQARPCSDRLKFACTDDPTVTFRPSPDSSITTRSAPSSSASTTASTPTTASTTVSSTPSPTTTPITTTTVATTTPSTTASSPESMTSSTTPAPSTVSSPDTSSSPKPATQETSGSPMTSTADGQTPSSAHAVTSGSTVSTTPGPVVSASSTPSGSTMEIYTIIPEEANYNIGLYAGLGAMGLLLIAIISVLCACVVCRRRRARRQLLYSVTEEGLAGVDNSVVLAVTPDDVFTANSMYGRTQKRVRLRSLKDLEMDTAIYARPFKPGKEEIVIS